MISAGPEGIGDSVRRTGMSEATPILPAHIEDTLQAIAKLHADHRQGAGKLQRTVERLTAFIGRPLFIALLTTAVAAWTCGNLAAGVAGLVAWDPPPFNWLQGGPGIACPVCHGAHPHHATP